MYASLRSFFSGELNAFYHFTKSETNTETNAEANLGNYANSRTTLMPANYGLISPNYAPSNLNTAFTKPIYVLEKSKYALFDPNCVFTTPKYALLSLYEAKA